MAKAKRGDVAVIEYRKDYGPPVTYALELVTSVDKQGMVKATRDFAFGRTSEPYALYHTQTSGGRPYQRYRCYWASTTLIPAGSVDVYALWVAWAARTDEKGWFPESFTSLDEVRDFVRPYQQN